MADNLPPRPEGRAVFGRCLSLDEAQQELEMNKTFDPDRAAHERFLESLALTSAVRAAEGIALRGEMEPVAAAEAVARAFVAARVVLSASAAPVAPVVRPD